jgi:hypothetical protein
MGRERLRGSPERCKPAFARPPHVCCYFRCGAEVLQVMQELSA